MSLCVDEIEGILSAHERMPTGASFQDGAVFSAREGAARCIARSMSRSGRPPL